MSLSKVLKKRRKELGYTLLEIAEMMNVTEATVQRWESGNIKSLRQERISKLAEILKTSPSVLMGWDEGDNKTAHIPDGFVPVPKTVRKPRLGVISCGIPIDNPENFDGYDEVPEHINCDFTLICHGDSMMNARIYDGDLVYIKQQTMVENGQIAAVLVDGTEKLLKRVYMTEDSIALQAENPSYPPMIYTKEDMNRVTIIGRAVGFTSAIK